MRGILIAASFLFSLLISFGCAQHRFGLRVTDQAGQPLSGVNVSVQSKDDHGTVGVTDASGAIAKIQAKPKDEIRLEKSGYLTAQILVHRDDVEIRKMTPAGAKAPLAALLFGGTQDAYEFERSEPIVEDQTITISLKEGKDPASAQEEILERGLQRFLEATTRPTTNSATQPTTSRILFDTIREIMSGNGSTSSEP